MNEEEIDSDDNSEKNVETNNNIEQNNEINENNEIQKNEDGVEETVSACLSLNNNGEDLALSLKIEGMGNKTANEIWNKLYGEDLIK